MNGPASFLTLAGADLLGSTRMPTSITSAPVIALVFARGQSQTSTPTSSTGYRMFTSSLMGSCRIMSSPKAVPSCTVSRKTEKPFSQHTELTRRTLYHSSRRHLKYCDALQRSWMTRRSGFGLEVARSLAGFGRYHCGFYCRCCAILLIPGCIHYV